MHKTTTTRTENEEVTKSNYQEVTKSNYQEVTKSNYQVTGKKEDGENKYGYVTSKVVEPVTKEVYSQSVEEINVKGVIKAVNGLD